MDILTRIRDGMSSFSKNHKKIATYIVQNYDKAAFMTANKLGNTVEVSESTVVRFAVELGYDGYPKMQKALQEIVRNKLTSVQRIEITNTKFDSKNILKSALFSDIDNIRQTLEINNTEIFETAADKIISAKKVYVLATRSAAMLANFMSYYFKIILPYIRVVNCNSAAEMLEEMINIQPDDVVIGISFPRYSTRTVKAMKFAKDKGAQLIAITDTATSPIASFADYPLYAKSDMISFLDSLVAPLSVVNALIAAVGMRKNDEVSKTFERLEEIWDEYNIYE